MQFVKVDYDAYNQRFNLMEGELIGDLDNGGTYLVADSSIDEFLPGNRSKRDAIDSRTGKQLGVA
ncbi:MAG TPA: hypothetical protein VE422_38530 [Terriglobia bacterium]|nr:hypothetical protein [Terriglobia bacterium]